MGKKLTNEDFINKAKIIHGDKYDYSEIVYNGIERNVIIGCKEHGKFKQTPKRHLIGRGCRKCGIRESKLKAGYRKNKHVNKNVKDGKKRRVIYKDWVSLFQIKYGKKYDYTLITEQISSKVKIPIICNIHGVFYKQAWNHLNHGCCKCEVSDRVGPHQNSGYWSYTKWSNAGQKSKHFDSYKVYILKMYSDNELFFKIGKTFYTIKGRFHYRKDMQYKWEIVKIIESEDSRYISNLERELQRKNKKYKYLPLKKFAGRTECFSFIEDLDKI